MWVAFMLLCSTPAAISCEIMVKTEDVFYSEEACAQEAVIVARYFQQQGYLAIPDCQKVKMGVSL
jgi:hypothetical protein|tara:strand:- start:1351 stop:1545 length:195 start_codon:yes stop_codon:yes gene_type:complete